MSDQNLPGSSAPRSDALEQDLADFVRPTRRARLATRLRNYFLTGLLVAAPISITIYITVGFIDFVDKWFTPLIPVEYQPPIAVPGLGLVVAVVLLTLLGLLTANFFGRQLLNLGERIVARMPIVRNIYSALKQIFETVISQTGNSFREVGLIEWPHPGVYALVFVTTQSKGEIAHRTGEDLIGVFMPTTPNPTSGFLMFLARDKVTILDMTVEEGAKMIISAGLIEPAMKKLETPAG